MSVDVSRIPNRKDFDAVREAILQVDNNVSEIISGEGLVADVNGITGSVTITGTAVSTNVGTGTITIDAETAEDGVLTIAQGTGITISTPNTFSANQATNRTITITNNAPDQIVTWTQIGTNIAIIGNYPNFTADLNSTVTISGTLTAGNLTTGGTLTATDVVADDGTFSNSLTLDGKTVITELKAKGAVTFEEVEEISAITDTWGSETQTWETSLLPENTTSVTILHKDTSDQSSVYNTGGNVIQSVGVDTFGHIGSIETTDLDDRYLAFRNIATTNDNRTASATTYNDTLTFKGAGSVAVTKSATENEIRVGLAVSDIRFENGVRVARGFLYWQSNTVPTSADLPTGSTFSFDTYLLTINGSNWAEIPPTTGYSLTTYYISRYTSIDDGAGTTASRSVTFSAPEDSTGFEGVVTFNSLSEELGANGFTIIDGGRIKTGQIQSIGMNASDFDAGTSVYTNQGSFFNLGNGDIVTPEFSVVSGNAFFKGSVTVGSTVLTEENTLNSNTTASDVSGLGSLATQDTVDAATEVVGLGALAFDDNVDANTNVLNLGTLALLNNIDLSYISDAGAMAAIDQITSGNSLTYIGNGAIVTNFLAAEAVTAEKIAVEDLAADTAFINSLIANNILAQDGFFTGTINVNNNFEVNSSGNVTIDGDVLLDINSEIKGGVGGSWTINNQTISVGARVDDFNNVLTSYNSEFGFYGYNAASGNQRIFLDEKINYPSGNFSDIVIENDKGDVRVEANNIQLGGQTFDLTSPTFSANSGSIPLLGGLKINWIRRTNVSNQISGTWASAFTTVFGAVVTKGNNSSTYESATTAATCSYTNTNYYVDVNDSNRTVFIIAIGI